MTYRPLFDPRREVEFEPARAHRLGDRAPDGALDDRYEYDDEIVLAVNVALAAGRPLLVRGRPGTGKSSLARSVAAWLGWRFYTATVSSRTSARDLLWTFDTVARLADAQVAMVRERSAYISPGPLWWAFDPNSAGRRGMPAGAWEAAVAGGITPARDPSGSGQHERAVVLLDEIDKADPDVPNDLLVPLGSFQFTLDDGEVVMAGTAPLVILTTNEERDLPGAFLRRCVILALAEPTRDRLAAIALRHFPDLADPGSPGGLDPLLTDVLGEYERIGVARRAAGEPAPSVAELLDALAACRNLAAAPGSAEWDRVAGLLLSKATAMPENL